MVNRRIRIIAAMSGGVDSSVAAAILKQKGYDVVGVFMKFWSPPQGRDRSRQATRENTCCSAEAKADAQKIANKLGIPFYVVDARKDFKKYVVDYFINEYKKGRTPNPCVECNRWIKFGDFLLKKLLTFKADYIATGHYVRINNSKLMTAKDKTKDQSYFLWTLTQKQLSKILFPIGDYTKKEVRAMAKKLDLPVYEKKESQEICFVNRDLESFLKKYIKSKPGLIITTDGKKIGEHHGLAFYTIGQRKGIRIGGIGSASTSEPSLGGPFYVVDKDLKNNTLIVAQSDFNKALFKKEMKIEKMNWTRLDSRRRADARQGLRCRVKIRYLTPAVPCSVIGDRVVFENPQRAITSGQSAVFYKGNEVLGGGIIC